MTDLEILKLCAEAMGIHYEVSIDRSGENQFVEIVDECNPGNGGAYDPLNDDAQAMVLVKMLNMNIHAYPETDEWGAFLSGQSFSTHKSLNRAICDCIVKLREKKYG